MSTITTRRGALKLLGGAGLALSVSPALAGCVSSTGDGINPGLLTSKARLPAPFTVPLPVLRPRTPNKSATWPNPGILSELLCKS